MFLCWTAKQNVHDSADGELVLAVLTPEHEFIVDRVPLPEEEPLAAVRTSMGQPDTSAEPIDLPGLGVTMWADDEFIGKDLPENSFASILMHAFLGHSQRLEGAVVFTRYTEDGSLASLAEDDVYYLSMLLCRIDQLTVA